MQHAQITERGGVAAAAEGPHPPAPGPGEVLIALRASAINPVDVAVAAGRFYRPVPDPPYVPGVEAVGEVIAGEGHAPGTRVWCLSTHGGMAERFVASAADCHPVPDGVGDEMAVALGVAGLAGWMPVVDRGGLAPGERVVVLGANGTVGRVALWAARVAGAARTVAVVREHAVASMEGEADAVIAVEGEDLTGRLKGALQGPADLVVDPVWGEAAVAAISALGAGGRLVQVGNASGPTAPVPAGPLRGGRLDIRGFSIYLEEPAGLGRAYAALCEAAAADGLSLPIERFPLGRVGEAWERHLSGAGRVKVVVVP